jgi:hypothetical protein
MVDKAKAKNRYDQLIEKIFLDRYTAGATEVPFERTALEITAKELGIILPKNPGDVIYSRRF